jgi:hypothetical protein
MRYKSRQLFLHERGEKFRKNGEKFRLSGVCIFIGVVHHGTSLG